MNTTVMIKENKVFIIAGNGYSYPGKKLCKLEDTKNGFKVKFYSHSPALQDIYLSLDYDEAEYLLDAFLALKDKDNK